MYPQIGNHWLYATGGVLVGGLAIRCIGFPNLPLQNSGIGPYFKMCLCLQGGVAISAISTVIMKLTDISILWEGFPKLAFIASTIGLLKFYPRLGPIEANSSLNINNLSQCILFWFMPSIYYCCYNLMTLQWSLICFMYLITICITFGTLVPLKNNFFSDFGLKITVSSCVFLVIGLISNKVTDHYSVEMIINGSLIILLSGITIDDVQHLKVKYSDRFSDNTRNTPSEQSLSFSPLKKSFAIFIESAIMFGRIAAFVDACFNDDKT